jgi:hypothetical protein
MLSGASLSEYLKKAEEMYKEEIARTERYLTWDDIRIALLKEF